MLIIVLAIIVACAVGVSLLALALRRQDAPSHGSASSTGSYATWMGA